MARFAGLNTQVLGISVDHIPCLQAWSESLGGIHYPLLSDFWPHGGVAQRYGVLRADEGKSERAIFIIDPQGVIRYIDIHDIDEQPSNEVLLAELHKLNPAAKEIEPVRADLPLPHGGLVMYCTPWCPDCRRARAWLDGCGIPYTEVDISRHPAARTQVRAWANGKEVTPTFDIDGVIIVDFMPDRLAEVLHID